MCMVCICACVYTHIPELVTGDLLYTYITKRTRSKVRVRSLCQKIFYIKKMFYKKFYIKISISNFLYIIKIDCIYITYLYNLYAVACEALCLGGGILKIL